MNPLGDLVHRFARGPLGFNLGLVMFFSGIMLLLTLRLRRRRGLSHGWLDRRLPVPQRLGLVLVVALPELIFLARGLDVRLAVGWPVVVAALVGVNALERWRNPTLRVFRRANEGNHDAAVADLRARIDRQRGALAPAPVAADYAADPWSAPATPTLSKQARTQLINDLNNLGVVESTRKDWAAALAAYDEADALAVGSHPVITGNRGYALIELGRPVEGFPLLRGAIVALPPSARWVRAQFLTGLADKLIDRGQRAEAAPLLDLAWRAGRWENVHPRSGKKVRRDRITALRARLAEPPTTPAIPVATEEPIA